MLARAHAFTIDGLQTRHVSVEVDVRAGLPAFTIVGLADTAVREARERIRAAIRNCGYEFPARRITANLAPGGVPKAGPGLDLALACALLAASGQLEPEHLEGVALFGELGLDGSVRASKGTLAIAQATRAAGLTKLLLAGGRAQEACLIDDLEVGVVKSLQSAVRVLGGGTGDPLPSRAASATEEPTRGSELELGDVHGQTLAVEALVIAAAGGHNCLFSGTPGTGKTMLAQRIPSILPLLGRGQAIELARLQSAVGERIEALSLRRPFRAPHHSITASGLIGGARRGWLGEVVLAHHGVLFLDELSEFSRPVLEALRQPLEDGRVAIVRARHSAVYPTRFILLAATNPCACGWAGESDRCSCSESQLARHRRKLSGALLDRIDLLVNLRRESSMDDQVVRKTTAQARAQVLDGRERQAARLHAHGIELNAQMDRGMLRRHAALDAKGESMLRGAREHGLVSARGEHRVWRVARTIADLDQSARVRPGHVGAALGLRPDVAIAAGERIA